MGKDTNIEWCDSTINLSSGCDGCELWNSRKRTCYAGVLQTTRLSQVPKFEHLYSKDFGEVRMIPGRMAQAAAWPDLRGHRRPDKPWLDGMPRTIFVGDLGDFLSAQIKAEFLKAELLGAMTSAKGKRHFWMLLTKRPWRLVELADGWGGLPDNCMAMTTVTDQRTAEVRIPHLLRVKAKWHGVSCEPLLGPVDLTQVRARGHDRTCDCCGRLVHFNAFTGAFHCAGGCDGPTWNHTLDWVIVGGESGAGAEAMDARWARGLLDQCMMMKRPGFFKQWGGMDKKKAGRVFDGREWNGMPKLWEPSILENRATPGGAA